MPDEKTFHMTPDEFRRHGHAVVDWIADYYSRIESYPVLSRAEAGQVRSSLPASPPSTGEPFAAILADIEKLILPGIFPFLVTGMVTASGGAWNASIFAEYFTLNGKTLTTLGLGEQINAASANGQFPIILLGTILISLMVVTTNRLIWRRLYRLAETRYKLEG